MSELRVVHATIINKSVTIVDRPVRFDENGASEPLTPEEFDRAVGLACFTDAELIRHPAAYQPSAHAGADPVLEGEALLAAARLVFGLDEGDGWFDWWDSATEADAIDLVDDGMLEEAHLVALWDHEGRQHNRPGILAAIDTAIARHRPVKTAERINQALVKQSAATPNTKHGAKKGK